MERVNRRWREKLFFWYRNHFLF